MITFTLVKLAKRAGYNYWLYVKEIDPEMAVGDTVTYDKYAGRDLVIDDIQAYTIETAKEHRVEEATHLIMAHEIGEKIIIDNCSPFPARKDWKFFRKKFEKDLVE